MIVQASSVCLHNYLLSTENAKYLPNGFVDSFNGDKWIEGDWRTTMANDQNPALGNMRRIASNNYDFSAKDVRNHVKKFVTSVEGHQRCPWQYDHIRRSGKRYTPASE